MSDVVTEIESISTCGDDAQERPVEQAATSVTTDADCNTDAAEQRRTSEQPATLQHPHAAATRTTAESSERSSAGGLALNTVTAAAQHTPTSGQSERNPTESVPPDDIPRANATLESPALPVSARSRQSRTQVQTEDTPRESGTQSRSLHTRQQASTVERGQRTRQERALSEESPPSYSVLFSPSYMHNTPNTVTNPHSTPPTDTARIRHSSLGASHLRHSTSHVSHGHPNSTAFTGNTHCHCHLCNSSSSASFMHSYHQPSMPLPGEIQPYSEHSHAALRQPAQHHTTVLPMHHHGPTRDHNTASDYLKLSFLCVVLCTVHLNLPALFCVLCALAYSIKAKQLNSEGRFRRAGKYSRGALACNCLACCQYMVFVLAAVAVFVFVVLGVRVTL